MTVISTVCALAQYYTLGADPTSVKWRQLKSENFRIIYPADNDSLARQYLYLFEKTRIQNMSTAHIGTYKVPIILHPYNVNSNATVVWAPKRVDIYTTPKATPLYAGNWDHQLAVHEGRHVVQMSHYLEGFYGVVERIVGEQAIALGVGLHPTKALLEGDAVINETEFTQAGRGRSADFLKFYRAAFHEGDFRKDAEWRFGSFNMYAPGKYEYGYVVTAMARYASGNYYTSGDIMQQQTWWFWRILDVTHWSYRYASGLTQKQNWNLAAETMSKWWEEDYRARAPYNHLDTLLNKRSKYYFEYTDVLPTPDGGTLAAKVGTREATHLVKIDSEGNEHYRKPFSSGTSQMISDGKGHYYFSEIVPDPRWELRSFSILRSYDEASNKYRSITRNTRYFNPSLSQDGRSLIAVEYPPETGSNSSVVYVDIENGDVKNKIDAPSGWQLTNASERDGVIYAIANRMEGIGIARYADGIWSNIVEPQQASLRDLSILADGRLMFVSDLDGVSNIYTIDPSQSSPQLIRTGSARFGVTRPTMDAASGNLYYSDYDHRGYNAVRTPADSLFHKVVSFEDKYVDRISDSIARQSKRLSPQITPEEDLAFRNYADTVQSKSYNKLMHGIHIHSWAPVYVNVNRIMQLSYEQIYQLASVGATVMSQNELGTASTTLGYGYHNGFHSGHINFNYSGLYPVFELALDVNDRHKTVTTMKESTVMDETGILPLNYHIDTTATASVDFSAKAYVPINLSRNGWNIGIIPDVEFAISNDKISAFGDKERNKKSVLFNLRYYQMLNEPKAALAPRVGWGVSLNYKTMTGAHNQHGDLFYSNVYAYLPGFTDVQGWKVSWCWQKKVSGHPYAYVGNMAPAVRGYNEPILTDYHKFSVDYGIPFYGKIENFTTFFFYLQRFMLVPFADVAINNSPLAIKEGHFVKKGDMLQYSYGTKALFELHLFRFGFSFKFGVQYARTGENRNSFKVLFSTGL